MSILLALIAMTTASTWQREIVYQIFPRSYYDSNGDGHGDLVGITQKLREIAELGATALLINPIQASRVYHNYFADDFDRVDPEFGTNEDFRELCRQAHRRKMKVILDMEPQYVADGHRWWAEEFRTHLWREGSWLYGIDVPWYDGQKIQVAAINPNNPQVRKSIQETFLHWQDLGVDGFRLDHAMDDLDLKGVATGMLKGFWKPIIEACRKRNPNVFFVAEQSDWAGSVDRYYSEAGVDATFDFRLFGSFLTFDRGKIESALKARSPGFLFLENHDTQRFASAVGGDPLRLRLGIVFLMTAKGTPVLYYGQELGTEGRQGKWGSDGNDIPVRLAYRWSKNLDAPGSARWYKGSGPWAKTRYERNGGGTSLEEQRRDSESLYRFTQKMIAIRKRSRALSSGDLALLRVDNPNVLAYRRGTTRVYLNLSKTPQTVVERSRVPWMDLWAGGELPGVEGRKEIRLSPSGFAILAPR